MTDTDLLSEIQTVLMEPPDGGVTWTSGLWTATEVLNRFNERQNRFLKATRMLVGESSPIPVTAGESVYDLPQDWLTTVDVYWAGEDGTFRTLVRSDSFEADHGMPLWESTAGTPLLYMDEDSPLLTITIAPIPRVNGILTVLYVPQAGVQQGLGDPLGVPDEYATADKYGTLADLFGKDGRGASPERAQYCELRYQLDQEIAKIMIAGWA